MKLLYTVSDRNFAKDSSYRIFAAVLAEAGVE